MILEITHDLDDEGNPIVLVPLTGSDLTATLYREDFDFLIRKGVDPRWRLHHGIVVAKGRRRLSIARLITDAQVREAILYKDRNPRNLKRNNLVTAIGGGKFAARDFLAGENAAHYFLRNVQLKHTHKPVPWGPELVS